MGKKISFPFPLYAYLNKANKSCYLAKTQDCQSVDKTRINENTEYRVKMAVISVEWPSAGGGR